VCVGFDVVVIPNVLDPDSDEVVTDLKALEAEISRIGTSKILCVLSTASCFSPRAPDKIIEIAKICKRNDLAHVINNAYGLQSIETCGVITKVCVVPRVLVRFFENF